MMALRAARAPFNLAERRGIIKKLSTTVSAGKKGVLGVRREDKNRWERRAPMAPEHVSALCGQGVRVLVQPSNLRAWTDTQYRHAGAVISEDLSDASVILGVKEVPVKDILPNRTYVFFSHTIKAQEYNMKMLDTILDRNVRLLDYERMVDSSGQRVVKFGRFAGLAGMTDTLHLVGDRLLARGYNTPLVNMGYTHSYKDLSSVKKAIAHVGSDIVAKGLPKDIGPLTVVFTGNGAVSRGAQEIFKELPHEMVSIRDLREVVESGNTNLHKVYGCVADIDDFITHKDGSAFSRDDYFKYPENYVSNFHKTIAPYSSIIMNCIYWESKYPRLLTTNQMRQLADKNRQRLIALGDISADVGGSIEFMSKCTHIDDPYFFHDAKADKIHKDMNGDGVLIMSVDNLPAELPTESSLYFGSQLTPYLKDLAFSDASLPVSEQTDLPEVMQSAVITAHGALTPKYEYVSQLRATSEQRKKKVLILGSGMVVQPVVDYLCRSSYTHVTVASVVESESLALVSRHSNATARVLSVSEDPNGLADAVSSHDIVVSLVPAPMHPVVAKECIRLKKNLVTASYISPAMRELDAAAREAGVTIMNEIGLDPGIDHLSAMRIIHDTQAEGGEVLSFVSWCGGLPAPENSDNPLGYKFSWSPRGVLTAGLNASLYRSNGVEYATESGHLFKHAMPVACPYTGYNLEGLPNRNSVAYASQYGIESAHTMFRGTLRYAGFSSFMSALSGLGMFDASTIDLSGMTWSQVMDKYILTESSGDLTQRLQYRLSANSEKDAATIRSHINGINWLGLLSDEPAAPAGSLLDSLCVLMQQRMAYAEGERDMVLLHHDIDVRRASGRREKLYSTLIDYADQHGTVRPGYTAMARTVGLPTALATELIMNGQVSKHGVHAPLTPDVYLPILEGLEREGLSLKETSVSLD